MFSDFDNALDVMVKTKPAKRDRDIDNGEYKAYISKIDAKVNDKGTHWLSFRCDIEDEQFAFVNFYFTTKSIDISVSKLETLSRDFGINFTREQFYTGKMEYLLETFSQLEGEIIDLKVTGEVGNRKYIIRRK